MVLALVRVARLCLIIGAILTTIFAWGCVYASFMLTGIPGWVPDVIEHRLVQLPGLDPS